MVLTGRTRAVAAVSALIGLILGTFVVLRDGEGATGQDRRTLRIMHYNLCGAAAACPWNGGRSGTGTSVARLVEQAASFRPDVVTVNEICLTQYAELKRQLAEAGWAMDGTYASAQDNVPNCGDTGRFGSAVLSRTNVPDEQQLYYSFTHTGGETYTNAGRTVLVRRGMLCAETWFAGRRLTACTAHTYRGAPEQLREIRDWADDPVRFPKDVPIVIGGDLNLPPDAPALAFLTDRFGEADQADREPTADGSKIDYLFAEKRYFTPGWADVVTYRESDHALLKGWFTLRL